MKEKNKEVEEMFHASVGWFDRINLIEFSCIMLKLLVRQPVQMRAKLMYEDLKKEETVQSSKDTFINVSLPLGMMFRMSLFLFCFL
jgi:hypothetical protein